MQPLSAAAAIFSILSIAAAPAGAADFKVRLSSAPKSLDWQVATSGSEGAVLQNLMRGLYRFHFGKAVPDLAESGKWDASNRNLTIQLKASEKWTDGKPLHCQHFVDGFERLLSPALNSPNASLLFDVEGARDFFLGKHKSFARVGIRCESDSRLEIRLDSSRPGFLQVLTHWPTFPYRKDKPTETIGHYRLADRAALRLAKVSRSTSGPDRVQFVVVPDGSRALLDFESGKLQYLLQLEDELLNEGVMKIPGLGFAEPARVVALLHLNPSRALTNSPEARRAILSRLPIGALLAASPYTRSPARSIIPMGIPGGPDPAPKPWVPQPTGKAPDGSLTLGHPNDALSKSIAQVIQEKSADLKIKIEPLAQSDLRRYDLIVSLFGLDYFSPDQLLSAFLSQGTLDFFDFTSAELLKRVKEARYADAVDYLQREAAIVAPLFYRKRAFVLDPKYEQTGYAGSPVLSLLRKASKK